MKLYVMNYTQYINFKLLMTEKQITFLKQNWTSLQIGYNSERIGNIR